MCKSLTSSVGFAFISISLGTFCILHKNTHRLAPNRMPQKRTLVSDHYELLLYYFNNNCKAQLVGEYPSGIDFLSSAPRKAGQKSLRGLHYRRRVESTAMLMAAAAAAVCLVGWLVLQAHNPTRFCKLSSLANRFQSLYRPSNMMTQFDGDQATRIRIFLWLWLPQIIPLLLLLSDARLHRSSR